MTAGSAVEREQGVTLEDLEPIALDELVGRAELLTRVDRKYLIPAAAAGAILHLVDPGTRVLEIDGRRAFGYDSVYFDTDDHLAYRLTAQRRRRRFKLRIREYTDTGGCFLEVKTKDGRGRTVKERMPYSPADRARLTLDGKRFVQAILQEHGHAGVTSRLQPSMSNRYRRATLLLPCGSRATVDSALRWSGADGRRRVSVDDHVIVETKSAGRASDLDRLLWRAGHRPTGISKFGVGMAAIDPALPHNKWARILSGPLSDRTSREGAA
ncbi:polyphosphate polymerase domain-containing protein [Microbacterium sp. NPDC058345]|uniref:polyphosphate polymerase domain-containing protein n=1 Tax=Microbacterium sp. NPDC058345 TaxID=3346455 RepID=UPI00366237DA